MHSLNAFHSSVLNDYDPHSPSHGYTSVKEARFFTDNTVKFTKYNMIWLWKKKQSLCTENAIQFKMMDFEDVIIYAEGTQPPPVIQGISHGKNILATQTYMGKIYWQRNT